MLLTTSGGGRSMAIVAVDAEERTAATRHRPRNHGIRGSLTTSESASPNWSRSHAASSARLGSRVPARPASNHALGRASPICTLTRRSRASWKSTTHWGSPNPLGLVPSAVTSGSGTCMPMCLRIPAIRLVPLRPEPATKTILRDVSVGPGVAAIDRSSSLTDSVPESSTGDCSSMNSTSKHFWFRLAQGQRSAGGSG